MSEPARSFYAMGITEWRQIKQRAETQVAVWEKALADFDEHEDELIHGKYVYTRKERQMMEREYGIFYFAAFVSVVCALLRVLFSELFNHEVLPLLGLAVFAGILSFGFSHCNLRKPKEE